MFMKILQSFRLTHNQRIKNYKILQKFVRRTSFSSHDTNTNIYLGIVSFIYSHHFTFVRLSFHSNDTIVSQK